MATAAMINMLTVGTRLTTIGDQVLSTPRYEKRLLSA